MPWNEVSAMSLRQEVVMRAAQGESIAALARAYGVSRKTIYKWRDRADRLRSCESVRPTPFA